MLDLQRFVQRLAMQMTSWQATTFLIGEYLSPESESSPVFTVADGILSLSQNLHHNSMVRKMQVVKIRGQAQAPGLHTFRISDHGIEVFPRVIMEQREAVESAEKLSTNEERVSMGTPGLDDMLGGGLPVGIFAARRRAIWFRKNYPGNGISCRRRAQGRTRCHCGV